MVMFNFFKIISIVISIKLSIIYATIGTIMIGQGCVRRSVHWGPVGLLLCCYGSCARVLVL